MKFKRITGICCGVLMIGSTLAVAFADSNVENDNNLSNTENNNTRR